MVLIRLGAVVNAHRIAHLSQSGGPFSVLAPCCMCRSAQWASTYCGGLPWVMNDKSAIWWCKDNPRATFQKYKISFLNDEIKVQGGISTLIPVRIDSCHQPQNSASTGDDRLDGRSGISCRFIPSHICSCAQNFLSGPTQKGRELVLMLISWISATMQGNPKKICTCLIQIYPFVRSLF